MQCYLLRIMTLCLLATPFSLHAADFELSVPIKLTRMMSSVGEVMVSCRVTNADEDIIGQGQEKLRLKAPDYDGKVVVSFNADMGKNPHEATLYQCTMRLRQVSGREYVIPQSETEEPDWPIWARARGDAELSYQISGSLAGDAADAPAAAAPKK
ncbi:MAG: hypothetical protein OEX12_10380 [Gammaproteobacteria bacterium]|nr:hypothetical protein [Gammaproteobacteria bacterium]